MLDGGMEEAKFELNSITGMKNFRDKEEVFDFYLDDTSRRRDDCHRGEMVESKQKTAKTECNEAGFVAVGLDLNTMLDTRHVVDGVGWLL